ncbi:ribosomal protein [Phlyctema vagabunda]|uniref:Ribosomal protein n=1 Tax=Phlyctema vagabunda TaxID=108571 RepID=A0ABR4PBY7_9HELO
MPPRIHAPSKAVASILRCKRTLLRSRQYATAAAAITPAATFEQMAGGPGPIVHYPATQPPSYKPPEFRKSQLLRQYASLLRSTPLMLLFQHNNLKATEWVGVRRELTKALQKVDVAQVAAGEPPLNLAANVKIQIVQTGIFAAALRVVEFYNPESQGDSQTGFTHSLSKAAHEAALDKKTAHGLAPLLSGPLVALTLPTVSPQHLKAAISILAPSAPDFRAPTRKANPGYHDLAVQNGLAKLMLLGARVEGRVFDVEGTKWVGGIPGGLGGLQAQLVAMLQGVGAGVTNTLESAAKNLYFTMESRKTMLEDEENGDSSKAEEPKA